MKDFKLNRSILFNPPLRIFTSAIPPAAPSEADQPSPRFERPELTCFVKRERVARHFEKRRPAFNSPQS